MEDATAHEVIAASHTREMQPLASLARLHRVDRMFNATIKGSPKLQRTMFCWQSAPHGKTRFTPLEWLFGHLGLAADFSDVHEWINLRLRNKTVGTPRGQLAAFRNSIARFPDASWRRVKVDGGSPDSEQLVQLQVFFCPPRHYKGKEYYREDLVYCGGSTLGDIFEFLCRVMDRKPKEHAVMAAHCTDEVGSHSSRRPACI